MSLIFAFFNARAHLSQIKVLFVGSLTYIMMLQAAAELAQNSASNTNIMLLDIRPIPICFRVYIVLVNILSLCSHSTNTLFQF
jgi:hypothetical protein